MPARRPAPFARREPRGSPAHTNQKAQEKENQGEATARGEEKEEAQENNFSDHFHRHFCVEFRPHAWIVFPATH